jgi:hypothetical protein
MTVEVVYTQCEELENGWGAEEKGYDTELSKSLVTILKECGVDIKGPEELLDKTALENLMKEQSNRGESVRKNIRNFGLSSCIERCNSRVCIIGDDFPEIPVKADYLSKANEWIFQKVKELTARKGELYKGLTLSRDIEDVIKSGIRPIYEKNFVPLTPLKATALGWANIGLAVIDPAGLEFIPVQYGTIYKDCEESICNRIEAEARVLYVPAENVKRVYSFKTDD